MTQRRVESLAQHLKHDTIHLVKAQHTKQNTFTCTHMGSMRVASYSFCAACWCLLAAILNPPHKTTTAAFVLNYDHNAIWSGPSQSTSSQLPALCAPRKIALAPHQKSRRRVMMSSRRCGDGHDEQREGRDARYNNLRIRRYRQESRFDVLALALSASSGQGAAGSSGSKAYFSASGPGAGVIDMRFKELKMGGFKVFLLFFLLGQGRAADNDVPFQVRETAEGIRLLIGDDDNSTQWEGVLDLSWGTDPQPYFRVDRIDTAEANPYPGELYILNKLLDAIIDINGERSVGEQQKLFLFPPEDSQLAAHKAKLASMSALH